MAPANGEAIMDWTTILDTFMLVMAWASGLFLLYGAALAVGYAFDLVPRRASPERAAFHAKPTAMIVALAIVFALAPKWLQGAAQAAPEHTLTSLKVQSLSATAEPRECEAGKSNTRDCVYR